MSEEIVLTLTCKKFVLDDREVISVEGDEEFERLVSDTGTRHQIYKLLTYEMLKGRYEIRPHSV